MVYKKFKDYKLEIIKLIFTESDPEKAINRIEELEADQSVTPSQITYLTNMFYKAEIFKFIRPTNVSEALSKKLNYETCIMVYDNKIIASYIPSKGLVYLE